MALIKNAEEFIWEKKLLNNLRWVSPHLGATPGQNFYNLTKVGIPDIEPAEEHSKTFRNDESFIAQNIVLHLFPGFSVFIAPDHIQGGHEQGLLLERGEVPDHAQVVIFQYEEAILGNNPVKIKLFLC